MPKSGLVINCNYPHLGASPDAIISCDCCREGCLEVKCPYCIRNSKIDDTPNTCLNVDGAGTFQLMHNHAYYYQTQTYYYQTDPYLFVDFIIWTVSDMHVERLVPNTAVHEEIITKSVQIFHAAILPELVGKLYSRVDVSKPHALPQTQNEPATRTVDVSSQTATATPDLEETWCICKEPEHGWMVECHNEAACDIHWFHFDCVGLKTPPKDDWYCSQCTKSLLHRHTITDHDLERED